jgi:hypothetical protein
MKSIEGDAIGKIYVSYIRDMPSYATCNIDMFYVLGMNMARGFISTKEITLVRGVLKGCIE